MEIFNININTNDEKFYNLINESLKENDIALYKKKKSFNELDLLTVGNAKKILGNKKRTRWSWSLDEFFKSYNN